MKSPKKYNYIFLVVLAVSIIILFINMVGCNQIKTVNIEFPFEMEDITNIEMYHYSGAPVSAEKKVVVAEDDIKFLYDMFEGLSLVSRETDDTAVAVTSFRFNLVDGYKVYRLQHILFKKRREIKDQIKTRLNHDHL